MSEQRKGFDAAMARRSDQKHGQWVGALFLAFGVIFALLGAQEGCYTKAARLPATVLEKRYHRGNPGLGKGSVGSPNTYSVRYRFTTPDGQVKEDSASVLPKTYRRVKTGDMIEIEYLASTGDSRIPGQTVPGGVFFGIGVFLICSGLYLRRRQPA